MDSVFWLGVILKFSQCRLIAKFEGETTRWVSFFGGDKAFLAIFISLEMGN
jgi:hypothetical protein